MMDYTVTRARSEGVTFTPCSQWDRAEATMAKATMAKATTFSPMPTTDEVDMLYCQLTKIHAISVV
jgi:hypothetical protein